MTVFATDQTVTDPLAELVGEGKKFKTNEDLAKGKVEADAFIEQLKHEQSELRKELESRVNAEKALEDLRTEVKALKELKTQTQTRENTTPQLTASEVEALVAKTITRQETERTVSQNINHANSEVVKHFGNADSAQEAVKTRATELGLTLEDLKAVAAKSPGAFLKMILPDVDATKVQNFSGSTVNTQANLVPNGQGPKEGTKEFYDVMRAKNPMLYWRPETQQALMKAAFAGTYVP